MFLPNIKKKTLNFLELLVRKGVHARTHARTHSESGIQKCASALNI